MLAGLFLWRTGRFPKRPRNNYGESNAVSIRNPVAKSKTTNVPQTSRSHAVAVGITIQSLDIAPLMRGRCEIDYYQ